MPKFNIDVHFDAYCARCGKGICSNCNTDIASKSGLKMQIEPCQNCLKREYSKGAKMVKLTERDLRKLRGKKICIPPLHKELNEAEQRFVALAKDHYWDTFEKDKDLIIKHIVGILVA